MNVAHFCIIFNLKIFGKVVTILNKLYMDFLNVGLIKIEPVLSQRRKAPGIIAQELKK